MSPPVLRDHLACDGSASRLRDRRGRIESRSRNATVMGRRYRAGKGRARIVERSPTPARPKNRQRHERIVAGMRRLPTDWATASTTSRSHGTWTCSLKKRGTISPMKRSIIEHVSTCTRHAFSTTRPEKWRRHPCDPRFAAVQRDGAAELNSDDVNRDVDADRLEVTHRVRPRGWQSSEASLRERGCSSVRNIK